MRTDCAMGTIIAVVAVLLIHIDKKNVGNMNPKSNLKCEKNEEELVLRIQSNVHIDFEM